MNVEEQIENYIANQAAAKQAELRVLHGLIQQTRPSTKLWFTDGTDNTGKVVANPNIGYGNYTIKYADGKTKEFFRVGLSGNKTAFRFTSWASRTRLFWPRLLVIPSEKRR